MLKDLCLLNGTSGDEADVRNYIIKEIKDFCEYSVDSLGSIIALKKGKKTPAEKVMLSAHMDEVGFIITSITDDGYLKLFICSLPTRRKKSLIFLIYLLTLVQRTRVKQNGMFHLAILCILLQILMSLVMVLSRQKPLMTE